MEVLSQNKIKLIRSLRLKKNRDAEHLFVIEGEKIVRELIAQHPDSVEFVCLTNDMAVDTSLTCYTTDTATLKSLSTLSTPSTMLAVVRKPDFNITGGGTTLILDEIQDPGNLGTIIRTADWFGIDSIVCSKNTADAYSAKVAQSSMGSIFRVPLIYTDLVAFIEQLDVPVFGALLNGKSIYSTQFPPSCAIVMGNEGKGISQQVQSKIDYAITVPSFGGAESLNVAIATGIFLSELRRS